MGELQPGELYAGSVRVGGIAQHMILLPAEACGVTWQQGKTFAAAVGGELPGLGDFGVLLQNLREKFAGDDAYWASDQLDRQHAKYIMEMGRPTFTAALTENEGTEGRDAN